MTTEDAGATEVRVAIGNAFKLGASLLCTWGLALAMRFWLPRQLGPERYGTLSFSDALAATFFVALGLGIDPYVRKEIPVRPAHASEFYGGLLVLRTAMSVAIVAALSFSMNVTGRPVEVRRLVYLFATAQIFVTNNATLSALLHSRGTVGGMSVLAVVTKIVWAIGALLVIFGDVGLWGIALSLFVSEAIETVVLYWLARRHLGLAFRVDPRATRSVLAQCLPHYVNMFAITVYGKLDVSLLAITSTSREVGYYSAASAVASCALLATPLMAWVMMPTLARAAARSREELFARIRRSSELVLAIAVPAALFVSLASDLSIRVLFGAAYAPSGTALRILAPTFVITYTAMVFAISLVMLDRAWTLAFISVGGLAVNVLLNLLLVPHTLRWMGAGGGGAGAALAMLGTELSVTSAMIGFVGRRAFDGRTLLMLAKSLAACVAVLVVDHLAGHWLGALRLPLEAMIYGVLVIVTGAVRIDEVSAFVRAIVGERASRLAHAHDAS